MIKILIVALVTCYSLISFAEADVEKTISDARWQKRIVLLFDDSQNFAQKQLKQWQQVDFNEWDIVIIQVSDNNLLLRKKYGISANQSQSILIGKDGGEKWRDKKLVDFSVLENLIEKMPMRQHEKL